MLKNAYFLAKIGADTAENERNFAEIVPIRYHARARRWERPGRRRPERHADAAARGSPEGERRQLPNPPRGRGR